MAQTDGEGPECIWPPLNEFAKATREMSAGHRHNAINFFVNDLNVRRVHQMGALRVFAQK